MSDLLSRAGIMPDAVGSDPLSAGAGASSAVATVAASETVLDVDRWTVRHARQLAEAIRPADTPAPTDDADAFVLADAVETVLAGKPAPAERPTDAQRAQWWGQLMQSPELATMRAKTVSRVALADVAAIALSRQWHEYVATIPPEPPPGDGAPGDGQGETGEDIDATVARIASTMRAVKDAQADVDAAESYAAGIGHGAATELNAETMLAALQRLKASPLLAAIVQQAGRWRAAVDRAQLARTDRPGSEIVGVQLGGDLSKALARESAYVAGAVPELEILYLARLAGKALMSYKTRHRAPVSRGPLVVTVDESSSMNGDRIISAKALALAMVHLARQQRRPIRLCAFAGTDAVRAVDGLGNSADVESWLTTQQGGGTICDGPLDTIPAQHWPAGAIGARADHIIISDGELDTDKYAAQYQEWAKRLGVRTWLIAIGVHDAGGWADIADKVYLMQALSPSAVGDMLGAL